MFDRCPKCSTSFIGDPIYETLLKSYGDHVRALEVAELYGATETEGHWRREYSIYDIKLDRVVAYRCPDCRYEWPSED